MKSNILNNFQNSNLNESVIENNSLNKSKKKSFSSASNFNDEFSNENLPGEIENVIFFKQLSTDEFDKKKGEYFCESFLITGISSTNPILINESEDFSPQCLHKNCSFLPAYQPDILFSYPKKNIKHFKLDKSVS